MQFDYPTSLFVSAAIHFILAIIFFIISQGSNYRSKESKYWILGFITVGMGNIVLNWENALVSPFKLLLSSVFIVSGICVMIAGLYHYLNKRINSIIYYILPVSIFFANLVFNYITPSVNLRMFSFSIIMAVLSLWIFIISYKGFQTDKSYGWNILIIVFGISIPVLVARAVIVMFSPMPANEFNGSVTVFFQFWFFVMNISTSIAIVIISAQKYLRLLQENITLRERMYSAIGHDLKEPFTHIYSLSNIALSKKISQSKCHEIMYKIRTLSQNANFMAKNLLEWAYSVQTEIKPKYQSIHVNQTIQTELEFYQEMAIQKQIKLNLIADQSFFLRTDENIFRLIIRNLINNAIKFTGQGGKVDVIIQKNNKNLLITIKDNGTGMTAEQVYQFRKGWNTMNTANKGIGLNLVTEHTKLINARIDVESKTKKGTTFYFSIPLN